VLCNPVFYSEDVINEIQNAGRVKFGEWRQIATRKEKYIHPSPKKKVGAGKKRNKKKSKTRKTNRVWP